METFFQKHSVLQERVHWQEFDRGHTESLQMCDHGRMGEGAERPALARRDFVQKLGVAFYVRFIDDSLAPRDFGSLVVVQAERGIYHHTLGHSAGIIATIERQVSSRGVETIAE